MINKRININYLLSSDVSGVASTVVMRDLNFGDLNDRFLLPSIASEVLKERVMRDLVRVQEFMAPAVGGVNSIEFLSMVEVLGEAFRENDQKFTEETALNWADNFIFPISVYTTDLNDFIRVDGSLEALVRLRQGDTSSVRMNLARVNNLNLVESEWKRRLVAMADGIPIITPPGFVPSNVPPKLRQKYLRLAPAINKSIYELYKNRLIVILPTSVAKDIKGVHFSALHWTLQADKEQGRTLADPSSGSNPLNTPEAKKLVDIVCGEIVHPTIQDMMNMVLSFANNDSSFHNMMLWKRDMAGAFTLLNILPAYVRLCAFELTDGLTMFYIYVFLVIVVYRVSSM